MPVAGAVEVPVPVAVEATVTEPRKLHSWSESEIRADWELVTVTVIGLDEAAIVYQIETRPVPAAFVQVWPRLSAIVAAVAASPMQTSRLPMPRTAKPAA